MAHDEELATRYRRCLKSAGEISEKRMMGGACFFLNGNMIGGADRQKDGSGRFMFRVGKENEAEALSHAGASIVELGKKRMGGLIFVEEALCDDVALEDWIALALRFVGSLPPK